MMILASSDVHSAMHVIALREALLVCNQPKENARLLTIFDPPP
jgi:hypothetical protein